MYKPPYEIVFTSHAVFRAKSRGIHVGLLNEIVQTGRFEWFGKNRVKIIKEYHHCTITCVDEKIGNTIKIVTVTKKGWL